MLRLLRHCTSLVGCRAAAKETAGRDGDSHACSCRSSRRVNSHRMRLVSSPAPFWHRKASRRPASGHSTVMSFSLSLCVFAALEQNSKMGSIIALKRKLQNELQVRVVVNLCEVSTCVCWSVAVVFSDMGVHLRSDQAGASPYAASVAFPAQPGRAAGSREAAHGKRGRSLHT